MQNFQKTLNSVSIMSVVTFTIAMTILMFFSFFLTTVPNAI